MGKGEPSRFIQQIRRELSQQYPDNITLTEEVLSAVNVASTITRQDSAEKSPAVLSRIHELVNRGLSPSALNKFRGCPLKFYYENVLGVDEPDQVSEDLEQNELGSCIHAVLENIYSQDADRHIRPETLQRALADIDTIIEQALSEQFQHGRSSSGRNHFFKSVAKTQISNFLKSELKYLNSVGNIDIIGLEQPLEHAIDVAVGDSATRVLIKGIADRIDLTCGTIRVIDYKSGKVDSRDLHVSEPLPDWNEVSDKWLQLMTYEWLFHYNHTGSEPHISGIFPLRHLNSQLLTATWEGSDIITPAHLDSFEALLCQLASDLLNPAIPLLPNPGNKMCPYCPFSEICNL
jgi:ATP-dependent helicase/DNAse subunit B